MSIKYNDNGTFKDIKVKVGDNIPVGAEFDYDGSTIPVGYEEVTTHKNYNIYELYSTNSITAQSSVAFSDDISNYDYIEIFYGQSGNFISNVKVIAKVDNSVMLPIHAVASASNTIYYNVARYKFTSNGMTFERVCQKEFTTSGSISTTGGTTPTNINIIKVLGYKEA